MSTYTNEQIAADLGLWNEYFNTLAVMTDDEFHAMSYECRLKMLVESFGEDDNDANDGPCKA